jgi:hypothetical protein
MPSISTRIVSPSTTLVTVPTLVGPFGPNVRSGVREGALGVGSAVGVGVAAGVDEAMATWDAGAVGGSSDTFDNALIARTTATPAAP